MIHFFLHAIFKQSFNFTGLFFFHINNYISLFFFFYMILSFSHLISFVIHGIHLISNVTPPLLPHTQFINFFPPFNFDIWFMNFCLVHLFSHGPFIFMWLFFFRIINIKISQGSFSWFHLCSRFTQWLYITFHTWFLHVIRLFSHMIFYTQLRIFLFFTFRLFSHVQSFLSRPHLFSLVIFIPWFIYFYVILFHTYGIRMMSRFLSVDFFHVFFFLPTFNHIRYNTFSREMYGIFLQG